MLRRIEHLEASRQEFVSNVSHELKTPITSIKVLADSLLTEPDSPPEVYREFLRDINEEIDRENKIISMGYNGMPRCCNDDEYPWERDGEPLDSKYIYVCHAELNAILNCHGGSLKDAVCYTTLFPCNECAKAIIQSGISEVVYLSDKYADTPSTVASKKMFDSAGVKYMAFESNNKTINIKL